MIRKSTSKRSTAIKICGLTKTAQARSIAELKINAIGVIGVKNSPRFVPEEECIKIFNEIESNMKYKRDINSLIMPMSNPILLKNDKQLKQHVWF